MIKGYLGKVHVFRSLALVFQVVSIKHVQCVNEDFLLLALDGFCLGWGGGVCRFISFFLLWFLFAQFFLQLLRIAFSLA